MFCCCFFLFSFSARSPRSLGRSPRNYATWSEMGANLKNRSKIWGSSPQKICCIVEVPATETSECLQLNGNCYSGYYTGAIAYCIFIKTSYLIILLSWCLFVYNCSINAANKLKKWTTPNCSTKNYWQTNQTSEIRCIGCCCCSTSATPTPPTSCERPSSECRLVDILSDGKASTARHASEATCGPSDATTSTSPRPRSTTADDCVAQSQQSTCPSTLVICLYHLHTHSNTQKQTRHDGPKLINWRLTVNDSSPSHITWWHGTK